MKRLFISFAYGSPASVLENIVLDADIPVNEGEVRELEHRIVNLKGWATRIVILSMQVLPL